MKKGLLAVVILLVLVAGGGIYYLTTNLNPIVEAAIERHGSRATQTAVSVEGVDIDLRAGRASIAGITVANPEGFETDTAFQLEGITVDINIRETARDTVVFDEISILQPQVFFEVNGQGRDNLTVLKENLAIQPAEEPAQGPNLKISELQFSDARLHARITPADRSYDLELPSFTLDGLGGANGAPAGAVAREIISRLLEQALAKVRQEGINQAVERARGEVESRGREILDESGGELQQKTRDALEGFFN